MTLPIIHCLTTVPRSDRHSQIVQQSVEQNFGLRFFFGERPEARNDVKKAIVKGHKSIVQYAKDNKMPFVVIAEDDLMFFNEKPGAYQYFIDSIPKSFDMFFGVIYNGSVNDEGKVLNGMSGTMSLFVVHSRFYNWFLNEIPEDCHIDRFCGDHAHQFEYYVCSPMVAYQSGGYSDNLRKVMFYNVYLEGKELFGIEKLNE